MILTKQTTVAYRCPHCGTGVMSLVGLFSLKADMIKLKCSCHQSEMSIVYNDDGKIRLSVPCIICPQPHHFVVNESIFFGRDLFVLPCPYSDVNICMIGESNAVKAELARTELELLDLLEENGVDSFEALHRSQTTAVLPDPQIFEIVLFVIKDLEAEGKIRCHCPENEEGDYECEVGEDGILVRCRKCGAQRLIPTDSLLGAHAFLNCDNLHLE